MSTEVHDPCEFLPTFGEMDEHLLGRGCHYELHHKMGARIVTHQGVEGVSFAVWAPMAKGVSVVGDFNGWNGQLHPMRPMGASGVWETFVPGLGEGERYKFEVTAADGEKFHKADPFAYYSEVRPKNASVVFEVDRYTWHDESWMRRRFQKKPGPLNIYEVHLGSWKWRDGQWLNYRELGVELAHYCERMGFTHVELLPVAEHPLDESWGYQVTGFFAVTSRFGTPEDFQYMVDLLHQHNIGVIVDWVPGHFPSDDWALARFDGSALYSFLDTRKGFHPHWNTYIFNYSRHEVANFLIANALFWFEKMHIDGLRTDAVASMLYLNYGREEGEWVPNHFGGSENLAAIEFLRHLNSIVHRRHPGVLMIAEESTTYPGVTSPNGLGFDLKWNMGWMNDTLSFFQTPYDERPGQMGRLTFGMMYFYAERFLNVLSHDEVVHLKRSLLKKSSADPHANLRLLLSYMTCQPGGQLLFQGGEFGQTTEWNEREELPWYLLDEPAHRDIQRMTRDLNHLYRHTPALWELDHDPEGFQWIDCEDTENCVLTYRRKSSHQEVVCVHNFLPRHHEAYEVKYGVEAVAEIFTTDDYGGSGERRKQPEIVRHYDGAPLGFKIALPPLSTLIFRVK